MIPPSCPSNIGLRPASPNDRGRVFDWLVKAYDGPFFCREEPPPTWDEFCADYAEFFFDGSVPKGGGVFIISEAGQDIGAVSYDARYRQAGEADIDIWLAKEELCGRGKGTAALEILADILKEQLGFKRLLISPCGHNLRAVRAYEKVGFRKLGLPKDELQRRYGPLDCSHAQVMLRTL